MNLVRLVELFHSEDACREYLEHLRWPNGLACLRCGSTSISRISTRNQLDCSDCNFRFSVTAGTIFHDSHLPLSKWFLAAYMMMEAKKGISAKQVERTLGIAYRTAWYLCPSFRDGHSTGNPASSLNGSRDCRLVSGDCQSVWFRTVSSLRNPRWGSSASRADRPSPSRNPFCRGFGSCTAPVTCRRSSRISVRVLSDRGTAESDFFGQ